MSVSKKRITLVISTLRAGGAERVFSSMANYWAAAGVQVTMVTLMSPEHDHYVLDPKVERITVGFFGAPANSWRRVTDFFERMRKLRKAILSTQPDVVLSFVEKTNVRVLIGMLGTEVPVVVSERSNPEKWPLEWIWHVLRKWSYRRAAAIVVQTDAIAEWARDLVSHDRIVVIPNPLAPEVIMLNAIEERRKTVVAMGRLSHEKGFDLLLSAWAQVSKVAPQWRLQILGDGPDRESLQKLVEQLGITQSVSFEGLVTRPQDYLDQSSVFVLSSRFEGFPNALLEAMAMGNAVVSFDCDNGPRDIIRNATEGLLVPPQDPEALAATLVHLLEDEALRIALARSAKHASERFSQAAVMARWEQALDVR